MLLVAMLEGQRRGLMQSSPRHKAAGNSVQAQQEDAHLATMILVKVALWKDDEFGSKVPELREKSKKLYTVSGCLSKSNISTNLGSRTMTGSYQCLARLPPGSCLLVAFATLSASRVAFQAPVLGTQMHRQSASIPPSVSREQSYHWPPPFSKCYAAIVSSRHLGFFDA